MTYKNDLQLDYSGREIALQRIKIIDSTIFNDETARKYSEQRRRKYQRLLEKSDEKVADIKSRIREDISLKKLQLEEYTTESHHVSTRYKLGEISLQECEKEEKILQKRYDRVKQEVAELDRLLETSRSSEVGGQISIDIETEVDGYGNINRKVAGLNIPNDIKMPDIGAFSNGKMPNGISVQGLNLSRGNEISLFGAIGGIIAIFLPWLKLSSSYWSSPDVISLYSSSQQSQVVAYYWIILLFFLIVCVYLSIKGRGAFTHIGIGATQLGVLIFVYVDILTSAGGVVVFQFEYGFYIAILFALLLLYGGIKEWRED
jgi:hypothetical protein